MKPIILGCLGLLALAASPQSAPTWSQAIWIDGRVCAESLAGKCL